MMRSVLAPSHPFPGQIATTSQSQDDAAYDAWFRAKVHEALNDARPAIPHQQVMDEVQALIDRRAKS